MRLGAAAVVMMMMSVFGCTGPNECGGGPIPTQCRAPGPVVLDIDGVGQYPLTEDAVIDVDLDTLLRSCVRRVPVMLTNLGAGPLSVTLTSSSPALVPPSSPLELPPGQAVASELVIGPHDADTFDATLTLSGGALFSSQLRLKGLLFETSVEVPQLLDFGGVEVGFQSTIARAAVSGLSGDFSSADSMLFFAPKTLGPQRVIGSWDFMKSCPDLAKVRVLGDGVSQVLVVTPPPTDFGEVRVGSSSEVVLKVGNLSLQPFVASMRNGDPSFSIASISPTGSALATRDDAGILVAGETEIRLRFTPATLGPRTGSLQLETSAPSTSPVRLINLRGAGIP